MRNLGFLLVLVAFVAPANVFAFCGFYVGGGDAKLFNDATQVVLMREGNTTVLAMQNKYEGPPNDFAMVVPVPQVLQKENVKTLEKAVFDRVDTLSAPRLVEYWERDPCSPRYEMKMADEAQFDESAAPPPTTGAPRGFVKVRSKFTVGEYEISVLETNDATTLDTWLKRNRYKIPDGAAPYFRPYIESGNYFFVAKVNAKKVTYKDGAAVLSPLRFHYKSDTFTLPIRLGMINSKGVQDLLVYILSPNQRYEVANYPNVTIPTNIEVSSETKKGFGDFYEALISRTFEETPKAVVTEYAWAAQSCDPCPWGIMGGSGLGAHDIQTLGGDALDANGVVRQRQGWVLTRLHARYAKDGVGEDLVFKKATPLLGGREFRNQDGQLEKGSIEGASNNFQGRYIIRNEWKGAVECENPAYGIWEGPPSGALEGPQSAPSANTRGAKVRPATKAAFESLLREAIPELKISAPAVTKTDRAKSDEATQQGTPKTKKSGCASATGSTSWLAVFVLAGFYLRRRRLGATQD